MYGAEIKFEMERESRTKGKEYKKNRGQKRINCENSIQLAAIRSGCTVYIHTYFFNGFCAYHNYPS